MQKTTFFRYSVLLVALVSAILSLPLNADPPEDYQFHSYDQGLSEASKKNKRVFIYFGREGCGFCEVTNKKGFSDASVQDRYKNNYELVYVDAESGKRLTLPTGERVTERDLGARYKAFVTPVFVFLEPDGNQILKRVGIQTAQQLLAYDDFVQKGLYKQQTFEQYEKKQK